MAAKNPTADVNALLSGFLDGADAGSAASIVAAAAADDTAAAEAPTATAATTAAPAAAAPVASAAAAPVAEDPSDEYSITNLIAKASELKEQGNVFFKAKEYYSAKAKYTKIPLYLNHLDLSEVAELGMIGSAGGSTGPKPADSQMAKIRELRNVCYQNSAICCYQLKEYARGLDFAERAVLCNKEKNQKSVLIRGKLKLVTGDIDGAKTDLEASAKFYAGKPEAADVAKELAKLSQAEAAHREKERKLFAGAFARASSTASTTTAAAAAAPTPTPAVPATAPAASSPDAAKA